MRFLIDTSALIDVFVNRKNAMAIREFVRDREFFISPITVYELGKAKKTDERIAEFLKNCEMVYFDYRSANIAASIFKKLLESGEAVNELDIFISGVAINNDLMLITKDRDFEKIKLASADFRVKIFE